jgi:hypothetical protein
MVTHDLSQLRLVDNAYGIHNGAVLRSSDD